MPKTLRIVAAQINPVVGDIAGNTKKIIASTLQARDELHGDAIVFPEMVLTGYPPEDLLLRPELYDRVTHAIKIIQKTLTNIYIIIGFPEKVKHLHYNSAAVIYNKKILATYRKQQLPNYGVFDEKRYFVPGTTVCLVKIKNVKTIISICEDLWFPYQTHDIKQAKAELIISLNASPFDMYKPYVRENILSKRAHETKVPLIYVNCVGGQDELVFDGGSMALNAQGKVTHRAEFFEEVLMPIDLDITKKPLLKIHNILPINNLEERVYKALVLGVRDYINKNTFKGVIVSVSGGIDSALTLAIAVDALGKDRVETIFMPSKYTSKLSHDIVKQQTAILGTKLTTIAIDSIFQAFLKSLKKPFANLPTNITEENIQARCRAILLMAFSNKKKLVVLSTGNKSETGVGYATLYGDMVGGFCVLKDVFKTLVYRLAKYRNKIAPTIPIMAIKRPPTAELKLHQKDTDALPPYPILDEILERYIEHDQSIATIIAAGFARKTVTKVINMVNSNEYKRRQAPPGVRITARAFGKDRRYPITSRF
jgi:NAD+ synthase (glutamine-hydrolysing)